MKHFELWAYARGARAINMQRDSQRSAFPAQRARPKLYVLSVHHAIILRSQRWYTSIKKKSINMKLFWGILEAPPRIPATNGDAVGLRRNIPPTPSVRTVLYIPYSKKRTPAESSRQSRRGRA